MGMIHSSAGRLVMMSGMKSKFWLLLATAVILGSAWGALAQTPAVAADGPQFTSANELVRPENFREWIFVSSGVGMSYGPNTPAADRPPSFTNVYVNPSSYRSFMKTGRWPDKTILILEIRGSASEESINKAGRFQAGLLAIEALVKDEARLPGGWGFFDFGRASALRDTVKALPQTASCYSCHLKNAAVERTFVQFYPTLLDVARRMGTLNPSFEQPSSERR